MEKSPQQLTFFTLNPWDDVAEAIRAQNGQAYADAFKSRLKTVFGDNADAVFESIGKSQATSMTVLGVTYPMPPIVTKPKSIPNWNWAPGKLIDIDNEITEYETRNLNHPRMTAEEEALSDEFFPAGDGF